jgi:hypothetical protein
LLQSFSGLWMRVFPAKALVHHHFDMFLSLTLRVPPRVLRARPIVIVLDAIGAEDRQPGGCSLEIAHPSGFKHQ